MDVFVAVFHWVDRGKCGQNGMEVFSLWCFAAVIRIIIFSRHARGLIQSHDL